MKVNRVTAFNPLLAGMVILIIGLPSAFAQLTEGSLWRDAIITELDVDFGGTGFHARWIFHRCDCGDLLVKVEQVAPDDVLTGELLMVDGQVLLSRDFEQQGGDIEPFIQAPSLMLQLTYELLNSSQPQGPYAVNKKQRWNKTEKKRDFNVDTGLATGTFAAPWAIKGSGWETGTGKRRFELDFQFDSTIPDGPTQTGEMGFSGTLDFQKQAFPYPESTELNGWQIQWISLNDHESEPVADGLTLKELRQQIISQ